MTNTIELKAAIENYSTLLSRIHGIFDSWNLNHGLINKIDICIEEIFVNISSYAYNGESGIARISVDKINDKIVLKFEDEGTEYNPLLKEDPDITLSYDKRQIGGLGIFMVKELANEIEYKRVGNRNLLTLKFSTT